jgi:cytochrome b6-f complex iron-sulfur subunit
MKTADKDPMPSTEKGTDRRGFLTRLWMLLGGAAILQGVWVASDFFRPRRRSLKEADGRSVVVAGPVDRFEPGSVTAFQEGKFYLARLETGGFLALSRECTHLGCTVPWSKEEQRFLCPCHASSFNIKGEVLAPPAPRPLNLFQVRIENKIVKVNIENPVERSEFKKAQVVSA